MENHLSVTNERFAEFSAKKHDGELSGRTQEKWDRDFLALAQFWAERKSLDPSTKTGACITRGREIVSLGYNGFPRGVLDLPERYADRPTKYSMVCHSELNSIVYARQSLIGCCLYTWPFQSCSRCACMVIQAGITRCVAPPITKDKEDRWGEDMALARQMFDEAGVELVILKDYL